MSTSTITVDGNPVVLVPFIATPAPKMIEPWVSDSVAAITSVFTGQTRTQGASGADLTGMTLTYPPLTASQAAPLIAMVKQLRGAARATQIAPADYRGPTGRPQGIPVLNGAHTAAATTLLTSGWHASQFRLLMPGDLLQLGYRLHEVLDVVDSDSSGNASFEIYPSLREDLATGTALVLNNPKGLYRLAANKRSWSVGLPRITSLSIPFVEFR